MSRRHHVPGTAGKRTLFVLPAIPDDATPELKNALAIRNASATEGACPCCGVVGEVTPHAQLDWVWHYTFRHEAWCAALTDERAA